ncbi:hypothetical protein B0H17DRAFT_1263363 [Mycena rosella]|uniref:Uncharacterized protein n=1 Tax=Mycena rosella TaxID=1033263 RepID=A0AAD7G4Y2_MYCRO|nr:hypothetical protein B0H17DRAFT_1263363 [Mycena rosella]
MFPMSFSSRHEERALGAAEILMEGLFRALAKRTRSALPSTSTTCLRLCHGERARSVVYSLMERILGFCKPPRNTLSSIFTMRFRLRRQKRAPQYPTLDDTPPNSDVRAQPSSHCPLASPRPIALASTPCFAATQFWRIHGQTHILGLNPLLYHRPLASPPPHRARLGSGLGFRWVEYLAFTRDRSGCGGVCPEPPRCISAYAARNGPAAPSASLMGGIFGYSPACSKCGRVCPAPLQWVSAYAARNEPVAPSASLMGGIFGLKLVADAEESAQHRYDGFPPTPRGTSPSRHQDFDRPIFWTLTRFLGSGAICGTGSRPDLEIQTAFGNPDRIRSGRPDAVWLSVSC